MLAAAVSNKPPIASHAIGAFVKKEAMMTTTNLEPATLAVDRRVVTMNAIRIHGYGRTEVLVEERAPRPKPRVDEVLLGVHAAGVNPVDWKVRAGYLTERRKSLIPQIRGWDVSGVVEAVGARVTDFKPGDAVFGMLDIMRNGAYAEYTLASAQTLASKPKALDHVHAAAVPLAALTAWQALFEVADLQPEHTVLIHAAAGGVGHFAVQLAKWKGARVIGTTSTSNLKFVRDLGADETIDYHARPFDKVVRDVDVVLDLIGGEVQQRSWPVIKKGGILVTALGVSSPNPAPTFGVRGDEVHVRPDAAQLAQLAELIDEGNLKPVVNAVLPLAEAAKAHKLSQTGHVRGKLVLKVIDPESLS
jgi:NADPH:quinone reductase-like Zn-dependent oxidoreductase